jgi:DNA-binding protein H-NS
MSSYDELMQQARALMQQAENVRKAELAGVIADIKATMKAYGISVGDLGGALPKKNTSGGDRSVAKYRGPNGELWGGGAGRKPDWVRHVISGGGDMEKYRI